MPKPFEYKFKNYHFRLHYFDGGLPEEERAKYEMIQITKWQEETPSPYPPKKDWIFRDLNELINFDKSRSRA